MNTRSDYESPVTINVPDAKTARDRVRACHYERAKRQIAHVEEVVNKAIANGSGGVSIDGTLDGPVIAALERLGYRVKCESHRNEDCVMITWVTSA